MLKVVYIYIFVKKRWYHDLLQKLFKSKYRDDDILIGRITTETEIRINSKGKIYYKPNALDGSGINVSSGKFI